MLLTVRALQFTQERKERAESDKATLLVMTKMLTVVDALPNGIKEHADQQIREFKEAVQEIKDHITQHVKPGTPARRG
jgi:hypothetical protein